jgi:hypothetical protein
MVDFKCHDLLGAGAAGCYRVFTSLNLDLEVVRQALSFIKWTGTNDLWSADLAQLAVAD